MMPFPGGIESLANGTLIFSAGASFFYFLKQAQPPSWRRTVAKAGSIALLALLALLEKGPLLLFVALVLSAAGDAFLAQEGEKPFLLGLASFLLAHLAYVALFWQLGSDLLLIAQDPWRLAVVAVALAAALWLLRRLLLAVAPPLRLPIAVYTPAIMAMLIAAATVPAPLVIGGAVLFVASDFILAAQKFLFAPASQHREWAGPAVWILYYFAQLAITLAVLL